MHTHELGVRWSDLDPNRHLNNVMYVAYAEEARAAMVDAGELADGETMSAVTVTFRQPLLLTRRPVLVTSARTDDRLDQEIASEGEGGRTSFAQVSTTFGPAADLAPVDVPAAGVSCLLRRTDLDGDGAATLTGLFDLVQEGRTRYAAAHRESFPADALVLGRMTVRLGPPLRWRAEPYLVRSWISKVSGALVMIESEVVDGQTVHAHAASVHVPFDITTQRSRRLDPDERARLTTLVHGEVDR